MSYVKLLQRFSFVPIPKGDGSSEKMPWPCLYYESVEQLLSELELTARTRAAVTTCLVLEKKDSKATFVDRGQKKPVAFLFGKAKENPGKLKAVYCYEAPENFAAKQAEYEHLYCHMENFVSAINDAITKTMKWYPKMLEEEEDDEEDFEIREIIVDAAKNDEPGVATAGTRSDEEDGFRTPPPRVALPAAAAVTDGYGRTSGSIENAKPPSDGKPSPTKGGALRETPANANDTTTERMESDPSKQAPTESSPKGTCPPSIAANPSPQAAVKETANAPRAKHDGPVKDSATSDVSSGDTAIDEGAKSSKTAKNSSRGPSQKKTAAQGTPETYKEGEAAAATEQSATTSTDSKTVSPGTSDVDRPPAKAGMTLEEEEASVDSGSVRPAAASLSSSSRKKTVTRSGRNVKQTVKARASYERIENVETPGDRKPPSSSHKNKPRSPDPKKVTGGEEAEEEDDGGKVPTFDDVKVLLQRAGYFFSEGVYCRPSKEKGSFADLEEGRYRFHDEMSFRKHLCQYGVTGDETLWTEEEKSTIQLWVRRAIVVASTVRGKYPQSDKLSFGEAWKLLEKLGFRRAGANRSGFLFPDVRKEDMVEGVNMFLNDRNDVTMGTEGLTTNLARIGLPANCDFGTVSSRERLSLELYISDCDQVQTL